MEQIRLVRTIDGEYTPRVYAMHGEDFNAMLDAVRNLPFKKFSDTFALGKSWKINGEGLKLLKEQNYEIEQSPDFQVHYPDFSQALHKVSENIYTIVVSFDLRQPDGNMAQNVAYLVTELRLYLTDAYISQSIREISRKRQETAYSFPASEKDAVHFAAQSAIRTYGYAIQVIFEQSLASRSEESFHIAIQAAERAVEENKDARRNYCVATIIDGKICVLSSDSPDAQRVAQECDSHLEAKRLAWLAEREAEKQERINNATTRVAEWFNRLNKREIIECLDERAQMKLDAKQAKQTKQQIIAEVVSNRELCVKLITS